MWIKKFLLGAYVVTPIQIIILLFWDIPRDILWKLTGNARFL